MSGREKDQATTHHQPFISSLVIRPSVSGDGAGADGSGGGRASDYEPGEVRREPPPYSRSDRFSDEPALNVAYKQLGLEEGMLVIRAGSGTPVRHRDADHRYSPDFNHTGGRSRGRDFGGARDAGRFRDSSPPYGRGRGGGRPFGRAFDGPGFGPGPFRGEGMSRNNPNVRPRDGDWICPEPSCRNLNFARREYCNNCNMFRHAPIGSPRRGYPGPPPPHAPPRRFPGPPLERSPGRTMNGHRSPPRGWARDGPREFGAGGLPPPRHDGRFSDHHIQRERLDYPEDDYRGRGKFDRPMPMDWGHRDHGRDAFFTGRRGFERRPPSPLLLPPPPPPPSFPHRDRWTRDIRERSRSPLRSGPPPKIYRRDMYVGRGRDERRAVGRDRIGNGY